MRSSMASSCSSSACHLFLFAFAFLAIAAPRVDAWGGRLFFSKMSGAELDNKAAADTTLLPEPVDPNSAPAFPRPSSGRNRGYGLYGRPEENFPPAYFRRGVHRDAEKRTTTDTEEAAPVAVPVEEARAAEPSYFSFPENGSGRGRPLSYARTRRQRQSYGMRQYENGRFYYDAETDNKYGYGDESNPVRTRPEESGSGGAERRGSYSSNAAGREYGDDNELGNGRPLEKKTSFEENQNEQNTP